ncbi:MAG: hypothetical protein U1E77_17765 [Inhella sp.]
MTRDASTAIAALLISAVAQATTYGGGNVDLQVRALATPEREHYVKSLRQSFARWCKLKSDVCVNELLIRPNGMTVPPPYDQVRVDFASNLNGKFEVSRYEQERPYKKFKPRTFRFQDKLKVTIYPFVWNRVEIRSKEQPATLKPLTNWAERSMDLEDAKQVPKGQLLGLVHSVIYPAIRDGIWQTTVDFGSSEPYKLDSLLRVFEAMGFTEIEVGSFSPVES